MENDIIAELLGGKDSPNELNHVFFKENSPEGYFSKEGFVTYLKQNKGTYKLDHVKSLIMNMHLKKPLMGLPSKGNNGGDKVVWARFKYGNINQNLPIVETERMYDFIMDYATGKLRNVQTFEQLLREAVGVETK